uniref:Integrase, catalytic region, zinc finger, CCHC-type, peptidase aspartic, catalytic n=1 Tax=Tanacetum cinerariifolium TaxID=118510 RepID=A0A6L2NA92_TANCI|nr:integrase, catalytic region, zinc finger, CCHC-type, peptidase aspartic, catalytic [Tanacetum cinerariifolium]
MVAIDKALVYDSNGSTEVHKYESCHDNEIFNMFTQKEQYTELLEDTSEPHLVQQDDSNVILVDSSMAPSRGELEQHHATVEETHTFFESLYNNLVTEVEKVNTVNRKMKETNANLNTELARYNGQEKCFEFNQEKFEKLESSYKKLVYQEQCITKKINVLHLSSAKQITTLNKKIANLNNYLSKEKSIVSYLQEERKKLKDGFKTRENELLDKLIKSEKKIKELNNILVKTGQSIQMMHIFSPKPYSFYYTKHKMDFSYENPQYLKQAQKKQQSLYNGKVLLDKYDPSAAYDSKETLQIAQESRLKMKHLNKEIKPINYTKINKLLEVFVSQKAKSREELCLSNTSKTASVSNTVSKPILIRDDEFLDNTSSPSVARKFLNEIKDTIVTLQCVAKSKMSLNVNNWSSTVHQEVHKILKDEIAPIVNQVDIRVINFEKQFLKEEAKFVRDFKSLTKETDESLDMNKVLEYENERLLRAVEPTSKQFLNSTSFLGGLYKFVYGASTRVAQSVAFRRNICFARNLEGVDLLKENHTTNLYTVNLHEMASASPICLMARATLTKSWLRHQRLSHLNFNTIHELTKYDLVTGLPKFKYYKEHLCPLCEQGNSKKNQTLVEAARMMMIFSCASLFLWAEPIATACYTHNCSLIHQRFDKTPYKLINGRKPDISFLHVFGAPCYLENDREEIEKLCAKGDIGFFIGYSATSCAYRVYNQRTRNIMETMNVTFDELSAMAFE